MRQLPHGSRGGRRGQTEAADGVLLAVSLIERDDEGRALRIADRGCCLEDRRMRPARFTRDRPTILTIAIDRFAHLEARLVEAGGRVLERHGLVRGTVELDARVWRLGDLRF